MEIDGGTCTTTDLKGYGLRFDYFGRGDLAVGAGYYTEPRRYFRSSHFDLFVSFEPVLLRTDEKFGMNCKSTLGLRLNTGKLFNRINLGLIASCNYDIPVTNKTGFTSGNHDLSVRAGARFHLNFLF